MESTASQTAVRLRRLRREDIPAVSELAGDAFDSEGIRGEVAEELAIYCDDGIETLNIREQRHSLPREYYVVMENDQEIGITGLYRFHWAWEGEAWLGWTAIGRRFQSKGIGSQMLTLLKQVAYENGFRVLHVETARNGRAKAFYLRNGFQECGFLPRHYASDFDAALLSCDLEEALGLAGADRDRR
jgi:GNAT superfamily N-acetyltransferase